MKVDGAFVESSANAPTGYDRKISENPVLRQGLVQAGCRSANLFNTNNCNCYNIPHVE